ncbi:MAG: DUF1232 domain-containing protein [Verrucomicrobiae bacterium]|nr:DUF1232 domain-containing protein [Verrucomicrobiae bacterium]MCP5539083.1 DUF1232 domain-containing protein [Akkermansiaceae bacterium]
MKTQQQPENSSHPPEKRGLVQSALVGLVGVVSAVYLFNPTAGIFELIPDNIPFFGNLDEATAAAILISSLAYFGIDLGHLFGKARNADRKKAPAAADSREAIDAEVVNR